MGSGPQTLKPGCRTSCSSPGTPDKHGGGRDAEFLSITFKQTNHICSTCIPVKKCNKKNLLLLLLLLLLLNFFTLLLQKHQLCSKSSPKLSSGTLKPSQQQSYPGCVAANRNRQCNERLETPSVEVSLRWMCKNLHLKSEQSSCHGISIQSIIITPTDPECVLLQRVVI